MLVLTRKIGESLTIGNDIKITVVEVKGKQVKIGVNAPPEYIIHREEVYEKIHRENRLAAEVGKLDLQVISNIWKESKSHNAGKK